MTELTKKQMATLLTVCAKFDGRTLDDGTFDAWHSLLADLPYEDVEDAIRTHYRTDRRWIMPADIVAHHEMLAAARQTEAARQSPPGCWGCDAAYVLSAAPGSRYALPAGEHAQGCRAMKGVLVFDDRDRTWGVMPVDPAVFDLAAWEERDRLPAPRRPVTGYLELEPGE